MRGRAASAQRRWRTAVVVCAAAVIVVTVGCARAGVRLEAVGARIPRDAARFEIESVDDSTASFRVFEARWIRSGQLAYVVDPAQRDALVARLRIVRRDGSVATALITSQAARVTTEQAVLVVRPPTPWWRTRVFWYGVATGGVLGAGTAAAAR